MASESKHDLRGARYEYRVWGRHKKARRLLASLASETVSEVIEDCYLIVDEPGMNAKVRSDTLKVKRLVGQRRGFERWVSKRHRVAASAPPPFDGIFRDLRLDRPARGEDYDLAEAVDGLDVDATTAVFVTKHRTRYRIGSVRADVTDITVASTGEVLHTMSIEGTDLDDLSALRSRLGLKDSENVAVHVAIEELL